jgi:hypothetical protein
MNAPDVALNFNFLRSSFNKLGGGMVFRPSFLPLENFSRLHKAEVERGIRVLSGPFY